MFRWLDNACVNVRLRKIFSCRGENSQSESNGQFNKLIGSLNPREWSKNSPMSRMSSVNLSDK